MFFGLLKHLGGETVFDFLRRKAAQIFALSGVDNVPNATEFIGWILNGYVGHFVVEFEAIVDDLLARREGETFDENGRPTDKQRRRPYLNHLRSDSQLLERWQHQHLTDSGSNVLGIGVVQVNGCVANGCVHCFAFAVCVLLIAVSKAERVISNDAPIHSPLLCTHQT